MVSVQKNSLRRDPVKTARKLTPKIVEKCWGRMVLGPWGVGLDAAEPIGEIIHDLPATHCPDPALLLKTLFTGAQLSVQVHPDAAAAKSHGLMRGKDEAWVVLAAEPGARIGLGLVAESSSDALAEAALDGSIVALLDWHDVTAGDVFFTPAGTIHAIGAGLTLFEIQQNCDVTWRLFDYGRGRQLQLAEAMVAANRSHWQPQPPARPLGDSRTLLIAGAYFIVEQLALAGTHYCGADAALWLAVVSGHGHIDGENFAPGQVWYVDAPVTLAGDAEIIVAYAGNSIHKRL